MKWRGKLTWLAVLAVSVSCGQIAERRDAPAMDPGCAGWRPVRIAESMVHRLAEEDPDTLAALIAHHQAGQARGCWR